MNDCLNGFTNPTGQAIPREKACAENRLLYCENIGVIFTGAVGSGKTVAAVCVADALVGGDVPVHRYTLLRLFTDLQNRWEKSELLDKLVSCSLPVLDNLGCERYSAYALEQLFRVVNTCCRTGKPLIMTINLTVEELKRPMDLRYERIYNRIAELYMAVAASGHSCRKKVRRLKRQRALALLGEEEKF
ncbi:hypothetical protein DSECCO2_625600 [anaerobic digester metagenome]